MSGQKFTSIGGQAVLEGVMMRSPHYVAISVRRPDQKIAIRSFRYRPWSEKLPILRRPVLRGVVTLLESLIQGMKALSFSAEVTSAEGEDAEPLTKSAIVTSMLFAFGLSIGLFVVFPHLLSSWIADVESPVFHAADGVIKVAVLLGYVALIARIPEIKRVFQFHGAEHQAIYTFESGEPLEIKNAEKHTRLHPRCGTSFLFFLVLISIVSFTFVFPILGFTRLAENRLLNHAAMIGLKTILMLPVAGLAYEFIRTCAGRMDQWLFRAMIWPGLQLQRLTTRTPDASQLEIALVSMREVLALEKNTLQVGDAPSERVIDALSDVPTAEAAVEEFPE